MFAACSLIYYDILYLDMRRLGGVDLVNLGPGYARDVNGPIQSMAFAVHGYAYAVHSFASQGRRPIKHKLWPFRRLFVPPGSRRNSHTTLALPDVAMPGSRRHSSLVGQIFGKEGMRRLAVEHVIAVACICQVVLQECLCELPRQSSFVKRLEHLKGL